MVKIEVISPQGDPHIVIGLNRSEFDGMLRGSVVQLELADYVGRYKKLFIIAGETDEAIEMEINSKMTRMN